MICISLFSLRFCIRWCLCVGPWLSHRRIFLSSDAIFVMWFTREKNIGKREQTTKFFYKHTSTTNNNTNNSKSQTKQCKKCPCSSEAWCSLTHYSTQIIQGVQLGRHAKARSAWYFCFVGTYFYYFNATVRQLTLFVLVKDVSVHVAQIIMR